MKYLIVVSLFSICCLQVHDQDYLKLANDCFEKGDYECAKRNLTLFQTLEGKVTRITNLREQKNLNFLDKKLHVPFAFYNFVASKCSFITLKLHIYEVLSWYINNKRYD